MSSPNLYDKIRLEKGEEHDRCRRNTEQDEPNQKIIMTVSCRRMVQVWEKNEQRPTILMHVCCAPCSTYTLEYLTKYADVTIYFANSNIHPKAEYHKRAYVTKKFVSDSMSELAIAFNT